MTNDPTPVTYDFKGSADYSMIKGLAAGQEDPYYESWFNDYIRVREIRDRMLGGHMPEEAVAAGATPARNPTPQQQTRSGGSGSGQQKQWPPSVVATTDDDGNATVGCSWHALADGRPRPMKVWEEDTGLMKCTGKTQKAGNQDGYCLLTYQPKREAVVAGNESPMPVEPDDLPF